ncbi:MAG: hypothetical protein COA50_03910 [Flavobacteriaceae bacterium]|nr:MAG: hypothetical protein COA50_03910 [Flavobacteriaceae bacterium]
MDSTYIRLFTGNSMLVAKIVGRLEEVGIIPIVKDYNNSGRLAGFGQIFTGEQEIVVSEEEFSQARKILSAIGI